MVHAIHKQEAKTPSIRVKARKEQLEAFANLSAFVMDVQTELMAVHDSPLAKVQEALITPFIEEDLNLITELERHLAEHHPDFKPARVSVLKELIEEHTQKGKKQVSQPLLMDVNVAAGELAASELKLILDKAKHDLTLVTSYRNKLATEEPAKYHELLVYKIRRAAHAKQTVTMLIGADTDGVSRKGKYQAVKFTDT